LGKKKGNKTPQYSKPGTARLDRGGKGFLRTQRGSMAEKEGDQKKRQAKNAKKSQESMLDKRRGRLGRGTRPMKGRLKIHLKGRAGKKPDGRTKK